MIMENFIKLEIFTEIQDFDKLFINFKNNKFHHREKAICELLDEKFEEKSNFLPVIGEPYTNSYMCQIDLSRVSHVISQIFSINNKYYGFIKILETTEGKKLKDLEDYLVLKPVFCGGEINTFNIDIDRGPIYKRILNRKWL